MLFQLPNYKFGNDLKQFANAYEINYKKTLFLCPITCVFALVAVLYLKIPAIYSISSLLSLVGLQLHYAILAPFIAAYTTEENKTKWYSRTYYIGYSGWLITTYLGGMFTVQRFASRLGVSLSKAKDLTKFLAKKTSSQHILKEE